MNFGFFAPSTSPLYYLTRSMCTGHCKNFQYVTKQMQIYFVGMVFSHKHCLTRVLVSECQLIKTFLRSQNSEYSQFSQSSLHNTALCLCYTHTATVSKEVLQYIDILIISSNNSKLKMTLSQILL